MRGQASSSHVKLINHKPKPRAQTWARRPHRDASVHLPDVIEASVDVTGAPPDVIRRQRTSPFVDVSTVHRRELTQLLRDLTRPGASPYFVRT